MEKIIAGLKSARLSTYIFSAESLAPPSMCGIDWSSLERKLEQAAEEEARRKVFVLEHSY